MPIYDGPWPLKYEDVKELLTLKNLEGFSATVVTEIFEVDSEGSETQSLGCLSCPEVASAYTSLVRPTFPGRSYRSRKVTVLTNGASYFVVAEKPLPAMDAHAERHRLTELVLKKLPWPERQLLEAR